MIRPAKSNAPLPKVKVGELIFVAVRSWAGMNDEGGRAWVTKVNDDDTVDVRYVLRGKRQGVSLRDISKVVDTGQRPKRHSSSLQETKPKPASKKTTSASKKSTSASKKITPFSKKITPASKKSTPASKKTAPASKKTTRPDSRPKRPRPPSPKFVYTGDPPKYRRGEHVEARRPELDVGSNKTRFDYYFTHATVVKFLPRMSRRVHWYVLRFDSDKKELEVPESRDNFLHIRRITPPRNDVKVPRKKIAELQALTELSASTAKALLVACKNDVEQASASFFDKEGSDSDDTQRAVKILVSFPRKRKRSKAKADTVLKSKKRPPASVDIDQEDTQAPVSSKHSKSLPKRGMTKHKMKTGPMGRSRPLRQAFLSTRIDQDTSKHFNANTRWRRLSVRLKGVQHFVKFGINSMEAQGTRVVRCADAEHST